MKRPLLLIHGNAVHSAIWDLIRDKIPEEYEVFTPDLRGYGTSSPQLKIDATRGVMDWVDDIEAFAIEHQLNHAIVWGHSLGGNVLWGLLAKQPCWISEMVFISPGSPFGFGGTRGHSGVLNQPDGAGTGAGMVHPKFVANLNQKYVGECGESFAPKDVFANLFFNTPNEISLMHLVTCAFEMHMGKDAYPGDYQQSENWPFVKPGKWGPVNALSPVYQSELIKALKQPPKHEVKLKWIHGRQDPIVSNASYADAGYLGKMGVIPNWPGEDLYPPQPMIDQIREMFNFKKLQGYPVEEVELNECGHFPFLESESFWDYVFSS